MTTQARPYVVVPAIPPRPPQITLLGSSVRPDATSDPLVSYPDGSQLELLPSDLRDELQAREGEMWTRGFTYAPENHWAAEARDACDGTGVDLPALSAPSGLALAQAGGGTLANGSYSYQVTAVNANGETTALAPVAVTVSGGGGTASVKLTWQPTADNATYRIYGRVAGSIGLIGVAGPFDPDNPPSYTDLGSPAPGAAPPVSNTTGGPGPYTNQPTVSVIPWLALAEDSCSSWGFEERDFKGRALRLLENATPAAIEKEFWTGTLAQAKGLANNYLCNTSDPAFQDLTPGSGPASINRGLQILQDALAQTGFGGQGMIHVQPQTAPNLLSVRRVGSLLMDIFDNIIVPGSGYTGQCSGVGTPSATTAVMFATDMVACRVEREGTVTPDTFSEALDRGQAGQPNTIRFRAQKFVAAYFDGAAHYGVRVTLAT